jgi:predicted DNA repair protein MutK
MTKVAAKKTAGVLGDDLALNAQQVAGVRAARELPVVWAVAKGSFLNKAMLVPLALAISYFIPWAVIPLLMLGGAFLCFEGAEKLGHKFFHQQEEADHRQELLQALTDQDQDLIAVEKDKIKGAIRTDFILSAEIIVISLGTVADSTILKQLLVLATISIIMTVGVYGLVAAIVKLDDLGLYLSKKPGAARRLGNVLLALAPYLMKTLSVVGTAAMFMVGGAILMHGIPGGEDTLHHLAQSMSGNGLVAASVAYLASGMAGLLAGALLVTGWMLGRKAVT